MISHGNKPRTVLITGGAGDIGRATARRFLENGDRVCLSDIHPQGPGDEVARELHPENCFYVPADVANQNDVQRLLDLCLEKSGPIDVCVCNAAIVEMLPALEVTAEIWQRHLDVNLTGVFFTAQAAARQMVANKVKGVILMTSSWIQDLPQRNLLPYSTTKGAIKLLAKNLALELGPHGIRVNLLAPGSVDAGLSARLVREGKGTFDTTKPMIPLEGQIQSAEQCANAFFVMASEDLDYMTGTTLLLDGGLSLFNWSFPKK